MEYRDQTFENETIQLDGNTFTGCTFQNCMLVFDGTEPPNLGANQFRGDVVLTLRGNAVALAHLLSMLCLRGGDGGRDIVDQVFDQIRSGKYIHLTRE